MSSLQLKRAINPLECWAAIWPQLQDFSAPLPPSKRLVKDSRCVEPGDVFFALPGVKQSGQQFLDEARKKGASLLVSEGSLQLESLGDQVWHLQLPELANHLGQLLALSTGLDLGRIKTTAVTGTNGKSSVAHYLCQLRSQLGEKSVLVGTLGYGELHQLQPASHTTPDLFRLHGFYQDWVAQKVDAVCLEASSHALHQGRLDGLPITTAVLTNLTRDHLDYHQTLEAYGEAKALLFSRPEVEHQIINLDTSLGRELLTRQLPGQTLTYSLEEASADLLLTRSDFTARGVKAQLRWQGQHYDFTLPLLGRFNLANCLAALGVLLAEDRTPQELLPLVECLQPVEGRMQLLQPSSEEADRLPQVVVDYAHTPDALEQALAAVAQHAQGKIWCLLGCGGNRDQGKRALMGKVAAERADQVVVTDDNPRDEEASKIRAEILQAAGSRAQEIADRRLAIDAAIQQAGPDDWVLLAGKGHEDYQEIRGQRYPFMDSQVALEALSRRN
ncbi:UDP-N-acetylmuramoyl-L-alanyl-D-glutamate--2,6-diaminopimelate ligase [Marinospirillum perlucidum]|uniref:UDP-N-acetylmuramoyl-L-alanyl-D-glutamate--2, 6-diaminopimelate ligase n=1 Tax=Marinospirillum perlucidum TaxID=1982602 RepID=UPI000DF40047|nr:UDP-N-acetylmuramoyl-L-alanyl-D-glutamate--2,6-diaminopimelate ligase [Marinospirillum perlucidum]